MFRDHASSRPSDPTKAWPGTLTINQANAVTTSQSFRDTRDALYRSLVAHSCVPRIEHDGVVTEQLEKRFFPAGTAAKVLTYSKLERLFTLLIATGYVPLVSFQPAQLAQELNARKLHVYLAVLVTSKCDIESLLSFTEKLVATRAWTEAQREIAVLPVPVQYKDRLLTVLGDDVTADIFFQKQHDFFAPVIVKNKEVKGQFRRLPYVSEQLVGEGSFGKIFKVVVCPTNSEAESFDA